MSKRSDDFLINFKMIEIPGRKTPEQQLWCQVLDRALADYAFFYDWFIHLYKASGSQHADYPATMSRELRCLEWFFFSHESQPHNLNWIIDTCYNGNEGLASVIRRKVTERYRDNLARNQDNEVLKPFLPMLLQGAPVPDKPTLPAMKKPRSKRELIH